MMGGRLTGASRWRGGHQASRSRGSWFAAALLGVVLPGFGAAAPARAADPFYMVLLRDGILAYDRGDFAGAARGLRLACFGLLEEPEPLAECLVRLALAQAAAGDERAFGETFRRVVEVEERLGAYGKAPLPADLRAAFEARVAAAIPIATIESLPGFAPIAQRKVEAQMAALPAKQRRKELEGRLAREPRSATWNLLLAELDLEEGQAAQAVIRAEQAAALQPANARALCVRGMARARAGRCAEATADLAGCAESTRRADYAAALLGCRVELGQWSEAGALLAALPDGLRGDREIGRLAARVRQSGDGGRAGAGAEPGPAVTPPGPQGTNGAAASAAPGEPAVEASAGAPGGLSSATPAAAPDEAIAQKLARAREILLAAGSSPRDLKRALQLAREAAEARPGDREAQLLAAEAAYRNARWAEAVQFFRRGGDPGDGRPELLFYLAVSYYESGDRNAAAAVLRRSLPNLKRSEFIDGYTRKILGAAGK